MKPPTPKTELPPSAVLRKAVLGGSPINQLSVLAAVAASAASALTVHAPRPTRIEARQSLKVTLNRTGCVHAPSRNPCYANKHGETIRGIGPDQVLGPPLLGHYAKLDAGQHATVLPLAEMTAHPDQTQVGINTRAAETKVSLDHIEEKAQGEEKPEGEKREGDA